MDDPLTKIWPVGVSLTIFLRRQLGATCGIVEQCDAEKLVLSKAWSPNKGEWQDVKPIQEIDRTSIFKISKGGPPAPSTPYDFPSLAPELRNHVYEALAVQNRVILIRPRPAYLRTHATRIYLESCMTLKIGHGLS
jgi:hypothetical protein